MAETAEKPRYCTIDPGAPLMIAWQLRGKRALLVGGGAIAAGRLTYLLEADAHVTVISPTSSLHPAVRHRIHDDPSVASRITYHSREFKGGEDLDGVDICLTAIDDVETSREISNLCRERKIPVNVADIPASCDFYFGSVIRRGPLQIMVSTDGNGPRMAHIIRKRIEDNLPKNIGTAIEKVGLLREKLRKRAPGVGGPLGRKRMAWMIEVSEGLGVEQLAALDDAKMEKLLDEGWEKGQKISKRSPSLNDRFTAAGRLYGANVGSWLVGLALGICIGLYYRRR
jgi:precorrin-2 dehydrogenase/sirohydrochlorin ferrochelatase